MLMEYPIIVMNMMKHAMIYMGNNKNQASKYKYGLLGKLIFKRPGKRKNYYFINESRTLFEIQLVLELHKCVKIIHILYFL